MNNTEKITEENYLDYAGREMQGTDYYGVSNDTHEVITFPESQNVMNRDDVLLVADETGLELFGGSAYIVPKDVEIAIKLHVYKPLATNEEFDADKEKDDLRANLEYFGYGCQIYEVEKNEW